MTGSKERSFFARPVVLTVVVLLAVLVNGLFWAARFPAWHPNDEAQHYLYATHFDGVQPSEEEPTAQQIPRDLRAFTQLVDFGPHRTVKDAIDLSASRADEIKRLQAEADDPAMAAIFVDDAEVEDMRVIGHPGFENYHPPAYYVALGQVLRVGHAAGVGLRGRLLMGRMFSVVLGVLAAWLAMLLARVIWPEQWTLPALVGLMTGMQILVAFYTSVLNNENLAYLLFTAFLMLCARAIVYRPTWPLVAALVGVGLLAVATKVTMVVLFPAGLIALMLCDVTKRVRVAAGITLAVFVAIACAWLMIPLGGGESLQRHYGSEVPEPRSFPAEMFTFERIWEHAEMLPFYWGMRIGNAMWTDAWMPNKLHHFWSALFVLSTLLGLAMIRRLDRRRRKVMLWLLTAPLMLGLLLYAIDYRFASIIEGTFIVRAQYYIPTTAAQMTWMVWGLAGGLKRRAKTAVGVGLAIGFMGFNIWVLHRVLSPRYYGNTGWWEQCTQIAQIGPVSAMGVAMLDTLAILSAILASAALYIAFKASEQRRQT